VHWIAEAPCVAIFPAGDPLAAQPRIALRDLAQRRIVTVANRYRLRHRIDAAFAAARIHADVFLETNASLNAVMAARAGAGVAIVDPATGLGLAIEGVIARPLESVIPFYFGAVTPAGKPRRPAVDALLQAIQDATLALLEGVVLHDASQHDALLQRELRVSRARPKSLEIPA
jgi:hypothetical protein